VGEKRVESIQGGRNQHHLPPQKGAKGLKRKKGRSEGSPFILMRPIRTRYLQGEGKVGDPRLHLLTKAAGPTEERGKVTPEDALEEGEGDQKGNVVV